jgi:predicted RNA binding protein YcfA (HicA-like mRNA interferase family)
LKQVSGKALARAIEGRGWTLVRVKGSHHVFIKAGRRERIVIPIHGNQPLKIGFLRALMKIAELSERGNIDPDESESGSAA